jgi:uncharacterized protein (TIGR03435 family)
MIGVAYNVTMDVLEGGPQWVKDGDNRFDLEAKSVTPSITTEADLLVMLQKLLADRFKLKFHRETREIDGFAMTVAKDGLKIREAGPDEEERISLGVAGVLALADRNTAAGSGEKGGPPGVPATLSVQKISMTRLAQLLQAFVSGHIEDKTNLKGFYNASLVWERGQDILGPVQKQLGLNLEKRKIAINFFIVDHAERPTAN